MSVSSSALVHMLMQGPIMLHMAPFLSLVDVCRLTAVCQTLRFAWPVKYNACLAVLKKALAYFGWPRLPPLSDEVKRGSCEYNVFCGMMESKCRIANLDLDNQGVLFCVAEGCGYASNIRHAFAGRALTKFTQCSTCSRKKGLFKNYISIPYAARDQHWNEMYNWFGYDFIRQTDCATIMGRFYSPVQTLTCAVNLCLMSNCCMTVPIEFFKQQVAMHVEEFSKKYKRKKI